MTDSIPPGFQWDENKNRLNIQKHGIGFHDAVRIFEKLTLDQIDTREDYQEERTNSLGELDGRVILNVTHTERNGDVRLISARLAKEAERAAYREFLLEQTLPKQARGEAEGILAKSRRRRPGRGADRSHMSGETGAMMAGVKASGAPVPLRSQGRDVVHRSFILRVRAISHNSPPEALGNATAGEVLRCHSVGEGFLAKGFRRPSGNCRGRFAAIAEAMRRFLDPQPEFGARQINAVERGHPQAFPVAVEPDDEGQIGLVFGLHQGQAPRLVLS